MVWGLIIALIAVGLLFFALKGVKNDFEMTPIGWGVVAIMVILLTIENNRLIAAIDAKANSSDYSESIKETVSTCMSAVGLEHGLSQEEAQIVSIALKTAIPSMSRYIHTSDFVGKDEIAIVDAVGRVANKSINRRLWNISGWIFVTFVIGLFVILIFSGNKPKGNKTRYHAKESRRNGRYHSLGSTDAVYGRMLFDNERTGKHYLIYGYKAEGIEAIEKNMREYIVDINAFRSVNNMELVDCSTDDCLIKTKDFIENNF